MYLEYIIIYAGLGFLALLLIASIIMQTLILRKLKKVNGSQNISDQQKSVKMQKKTDGVVFCVKCATQFPATETVCPNCGTLR